MSVGVIIIYVLVISVTAIGLGSLAYGAHLAAPWVSTRPVEREAAVAALPLKDGAVLYDLGCGDAAILFAALDRNPRIRAVGLDVALPPLFTAWARRLLHRRRYAGLELRCADFFHQDLQDADVIFAYLLRKAYPAIVEKFSRELKDSSVAVIERWPLPGLEPVRTIAAEGIFPIYFYEGRQFRSLTGAR